MKFRSAIIDGIFHIHFEWSNGVSVARGLLALSNRIQTVICIVAYN